MNSKRGMTRVYVVLWIVLAVVGVLMAVQATAQGGTRRNHAAAFLRDHRHLSLADLQRMSLDSLKARVAPQLVAVQGSLVKFPTDISTDSIRSVLNAYSAESLSVALAGGKPLGRERYRTLRAQGVSDEQIVRFGSGDVPEGELTSLHADAASDAVMHPISSLLRIWGLWAAVCLASPALILWTLRWIESRFSALDAEL